MPEGLDGGAVAATESCIAVGTLPRRSGETTVLLCEESADAQREPAGHMLAFDGILDTPSRMLSVCTVPDDILLEVAVSQLRTRVRIWTNDDRQPDAITILPSPA